MGEHADGASHGAGVKDEQESQTEAGDQGQPGATETWDNGRTQSSFLPARGAGRGQLPSRPWRVPGTGTQWGVGFVTHRHTCLLHPQSICVQQPCSKGHGLGGERACLGFEET